MWLESYQNISRRVSKRTGAAVMKDSLDGLRKELSDFVTGISTNLYTDLSNQFRDLLNKMARKGLVDIGSDAGLRDDALELRVRMLFERAGMEVADPRPAKEDLVVEPPTDSGFYIPLVIEVKSSSKAIPSVDGLRQLDDWVFDLSGEKGVRKRGLCLWNTPRSGIRGVSIGAMQPPHIHPRRYKGIFVFNGPRGKPFENRPDYWLQEEQRQFAEDRGFCLISLQTLIAWAEACHNNYMCLRQFWQKIYETNGILVQPVDSLKRIGQ